MRIIDAKVIVCSPGRNFVTLKITTEDGIYGLGDATLNGRELAVASYLTDHVVPLLIGRDARRIEDTWQYLYKGAYWRRGPVTMTAIGAWTRRSGTSAARRSNTPVYQLLGGASRESVLIYGHANGDTIDDTVTAVARVRRGSAIARSARSAACPACSHAYGVGRGDALLRARRKAQAARDVLEHRALSRHRAAALRSAAEGVRPGRAPASRRRITGSRRSKRRGSASRSSRIICSGSRIRFPRSCRKASG